MTKVSLPAKNALLLQGPIGSFFRTLAKTLEDDGYQVFQVAFNAGDLINAKWKNTLCYNQGQQHWEGWLEELLKRESIKLVIVFGCERFHHKIARQVCNKFGISYFSLEEGYVRPGFISAEWSGNNWTSPIATLPTEKIRGTSHPKDVKPFGGKNFGKVIWLGFVYYNIRAIGRPYFSRAMYHKSRPVVPEAFKWIRNYYRWLTGKARNRKIVELLLGPMKNNFFFVPLQVSDDQQLTVAGEGWTNDRLIFDLINSFIDHADKKLLLVFKLHPMERGHSNDVRRILNLAREKGVSDRVLVIDDGPLSELVNVSRGMITINSTSGLSALLHHVPVAVLGKALYRRPDLATCINSIEDIHSFWKDPKACDHKTASGFRNALYNDALLPGDYYLKEYRQRAADGILKKLSEKQ